MEPIPSKTERSVRKSKHRERALLALSSMGEAYPGQLARALGLERARLKHVMEGKLPYYRPDLSLVGLGLAELVFTPEGRVYRVTTKGRRKARSLTARRRFRADVPASASRLGV